MQIVWFRRDLRLSDNEIVSKACQDKLPVLPCFVVDPWFYKQSDVAAARVRFLFESLENLDANLRSLGSRLHLFEGESVDVIGRLTRSLIEQGKQPKLYFSRDVQVQYGIDRDRQIVDFYSSHNLETYIGTNHFLQPNDQHLDDWWQDYHNYQSQSIYPTPQQINTSELDFDISQLTFAQLWQKYGRDQKSAISKFVGGEDQAQATLNSFLAHRYRGYHWKMSRPWLAQAGATSHLSAHFHFGTISTRTVYQKTNELLEQLGNQSKARFSLKTFLDRVRWHDKFTQRLYFYPQLATQNHYREFDEWYSPEALAGEKQELFQAWCEGKTGFPMVDASMRQLNSMGWMNFRMRAMCVTFLCVNCGVSWHHGAQYFLSRLVDGDIAINHWQWQAQAGVTNPMSNTFRIYNPTKNLQEKDPYLQFVHHWIPELKGYSLNQILKGEVSASGYPQPIVDWKQTRKVNGKIVSNIRAQVRERLEREQGEELDQAIRAKETVEKYFTVKDKQYQATQKSTYDQSRNK